MIGAWKSDINGFLQIFNVRSVNFTWSSLIVPSQTELAVNTHVAVSDIRHDVSKIHQNVSKIQEEIDQVRSVSASYIQSIDTKRMLTAAQVQTRSAILVTAIQYLTFAFSIPGESPPPPPRVCFGRDELIEKIVGLAENFTPLALIGPGGIGKTSIALTILHHDRVKQRFGSNRRFIRCDQFPTSRTHFLSRLSKVIGAGVENPEELTPLRPFLSSREMILFLDNAESILDPRGLNAREVYAVAEELSQIGNICLCFTSRISTIPPDCKRLDIPTLSMDAACNTFYRIYDGNERSGPVNAILERLDFHPLSITLLATVAHHNRWDANRLTKEWERQRTDVLHTQHDNSLATTIELSLASPMFQDLGPDARGLLGVIAFFPQGVNENNLDWLFPTLSKSATILDNLCILSLTYRSSGFVTMLAPLRDYLRPKDPASSPFLCTIKDHYFSRLSVQVYPGQPGFEAARWIRSEDVNVEYLLDVFTSIDTNSVNVWDSCGYFMGHLYWHKRRLVVLGPKIEGLPSDHPSKPGCLFQLSRLFDSVGNHMEYKRLLVRALKLWRERGDDSQVAQALMFLSDANEQLGLYKEGIQQTREALEIRERLNDRVGKAQSLQNLAWTLRLDGQLDAAEEAALRAIDLLSGEDDQQAVCQCYRALGDICRSRGETGKAVNYYGTALEIASSFNLQGQMFWINHALAVLFFSENKFDDAHAHIERAKAHAINDPYQLGRATERQAVFWYEEGRFEEARSEALRAVEVYEEIGATKDITDCKTILRNIETATKTLAASGGLDSNGKFLITVLLPTPFNSAFSAQGS